jgi:5'-3' exonuclease
MGIKGLSAFVKQFGKIKNLSDMRGKTVAIDAPIFMFRFKYLCDTPTFINRFRLQMNLFKSLDINCVYVFDGAHPKLKQETRETREKTQTIFITSEDKMLLKELIVDSGNNFVIAPGEAEKFCSYLNSEKIVDFVMSNDYDTFVFGCESLLVSTPGNSFIHFNPQEIISELKLSKEEFLNVCIASGCDFFASGIKGVGIKKAISLVKKQIDVQDWGGSPDFYSSLPAITDIFTNFKEEKVMAKTVEEMLIVKDPIEEMLVISEEVVVLPEEEDSCDESDGL